MLTISKYLVSSIEWIAKNYRCNHCSNKNNNVDICFKIIEVEEKQNLKETYALEFVICGGDKENTTLFCSQKKKIKWEYFYF